MKKLKGEYENREELEWSTVGLHKTILGIVPNGTGNAVDVGCGAGNLMVGLVEKGYSVVGVDIENFLKDDSLKFCKSDLDYDWDLDSNKFELITATEIIEHIENPRHFIREAKRVLKKNGIMIISTPNILNWKARLYYPLKGLIWGFREKDYKISGHITPVPIYDIQRICSELNLEIVKVTYNNSECGLFGDNLIVKIRKGVSNK